MPSQLHMLFGYGPPLSFAARARSGLALVKTVPSQNPFSFYAGAAVRGGDYVVLERKTLPGNYPCTMSASGLLVAVAHSDLRRQRVMAELYSRRLQMWTGAAGQYLNDHAPIGRFVNLTLAIGVTPAPLNLVSLFTDADGDFVTIGLVTGPLWPGAVSNSGQITGAPIAPGSGSFQVIAQDDANLLGIAQVNWTVPQGPPIVSSHVTHLRVKSHVGGAMTGN